jgi:penicillin V acylase-like amidase (Ntn superfamily)
MNDLLAIRFARASFYVKSIPQDGDSDHLLASVYGIIRNVSVPIGLRVG